jgi:hypothetical protein
VEHDHDVSQYAVDGLHTIRRRPPCSLFPRG